jgi:GMP synthase-like glutamine amidotransferase
MQKALSSARLLLVQTGSTQLHGDYPRWFERTLGFEMPVVRAHDGERLGPALDRVRPRGIIVTGSPLSVTENAPWMLQLGEDALFAWAAGAEIEVQATHVDAVDPLPAGATVLASNENSAAQAYRLSETVAGVQFHPELWPAALRDLIFSRREKLAAEGLDAEALAAQVREVEASAILRAFAVQAERA